MASFQRNKFLPPRHFPDLGLQMEWFLPQTSQMSLFLLLQLFFSLKRHSTAFGEHQNSVLPAIYLHFLLHAECPCTFGAESESPFVLCFQLFLASLSVEVITSKTDGFVSNSLSTLTVRLGSTCRLSPPYSARWRKFSKLAGALSWPLIIWNQCSSILDSYMNIKNWSALQNVNYCKHRYLKCRQKLTVSRSGSLVPAISLTITMFKCTIPHNFLL